MPVITLSRQFGSGGDEVARAVAERLGLRLAGREIINQAAREAGAPHVALSVLDELGLLGVEPCSDDCERYAAAVKSVIASWADTGNVLFVGRGGQVALTERRGVTRVRIIAPFALRVQRVSARHGVPEEIARALVEARDRARTAYVQRFYGHDANDPELYDMILNMAHLTIPAAVDLICQAVAEVSSQAVEVGP